MSRFSFMVLFWRFCGFILEVLKQEGYPFKELQLKNKHMFEAAVCVCLCVCVHVCVCVCVLVGVCFAAHTGVIEAVLFNMLILTCRK